MSMQAWRRSIHPKLRVILNSSGSVNAIRSETTGCLSVTPELADRAVPLSSGVRVSSDSDFEAGRAIGKTRRTEQSVAMSSAVDAATNPGKLGSEQPRDEVTVNIFIEGNKPLGKLAGARARRGNMAVLRVPVDKVESLAKRPDVAFIEHAENLKLPTAQRLNTGSQPPKSKAAKVAKSNLHVDGAGVLIGIIDVEGFDWAHPDFEGLDGESRFISIWDQGGETGKPPKKRHSGRAREGAAAEEEIFSYGTEITAAAMATARRDAKLVKVSPHDLEPQSQMIPGSHGTHVASIAAGNHGVCPMADIAAVLVSLPAGDFDRRTSFYDSTRLLDAIQYLVDLADERRQPVSINVSLGTNGHAHDGSSVLDRWIDALIAKPGRSVCVAAGNAGQERAEKPGDIGYILGRIHTSGKVSAKGLYTDIDWMVAGNSVIDVSENEIEFWYESQDRLSVSIKPPDGEWIGPIQPGEFLENFQLPDKSMISIYSELYHPANGSNYISIYLTPFMGQDVVVGVKAGSWTVRLQGLDIRDGRFHGWIERDDPHNLDSGQHFWPSFFSERSNMDSSSVSSLACGSRVIAVANLDEVNQRINISSSQGPTRDGRFKPDIAARGTEVRAANGFGDPKERWIDMTGTSMASPFVAGVVGLMLATRDNLTAAQIGGILKATARPLPGGTYQWANDSGFGVIDADLCVEQARTAHLRSDVKGRFEP